MPNTANRGYPKPVPSQFISDDVVLLIQTFDMIDADVAALLSSVSGKAATIHYHAIGDVTGLEGALAGKADSGHNHSLASLTDTGGLTEAPDGYILRKLAGIWQPSSAASLFSAHNHAIGDITNLQTALDGKIDAAGLAGATAKGAPVDADTIPLNDSTNSGALRRLSFANLWAWIRTRTDALYMPASAAAVTTGTILEFAGGNVPSGYLVCAGQAVSRTVYSALFAVVGTAFGAGDGSSTFNLPNASGTAPLNKIIKT